MAHEYPAPLWTSKGRRGVSSVVLSTEIVLINKDEALERRTPEKTVLYSRPLQRLLLNLAPVCSSQIGREQCLGKPR